MQKRKKKTQLQGKKEKKDKFGPFFGLCKVIVRQQDWKRKRGYFGSGYFLEMRIPFENERYFFVSDRLFFQTSLLFLAFLQTTLLLQERFDFFRSKAKKQNTMMPSDVWVSEWASENWKEWGSIHHISFFFIFFLLVFSWLVLLEKQITKGFLLLVRRETEALPRGDTVGPACPCGPRSGNLAWLWLHCGGTGGEGHHHHGLGLLGF